MAFAPYRLFRPSQPANSGQPGKVAQLRRRAAPVSALNAAGHALDNGEEGVNETFYETLMQRVLITPMPHDTDTITYHRENAIVGDH